MKIIYFLLLTLLFVACNDDPDDSMDPGLMAAEMIQPNQGFGDLLLSGDGNDVVAKFGNDFITGAVGLLDETSWGLFYDNGFSCQLDYAIADDLDLNVGIWLMFFESPFPGTTPEGIKVGSTIQEVRDAYGDFDSSIQFHGEGYASESMYFTFNSDSLVNKITLE